MHRSDVGRALVGLSVAVLLISAGVARMAAQGRTRTPDGHPDLQGLWLNDTATPLERPAGAGKTFTDEEAQAYEQRYQLDRTVAISRNKDFELDAAGDLDTYEPGHVLPGGRTSMITDPDDGKVPALTPPAQKRLAERTQHLNEHYADNPEDLTFAERCLIVANTSVPPLMPAFYNNTLQIVQTRDSVVFLSEQIHDIRVIALNRRTHLPPNIRMWKGDSIGRWEGDTLVVDTTNFTEKTSFRGSGTTLHLIERFRLSAPGTLDYQFTVDDPASFVRSWTAHSEMSRTEGPMFEFSCHEANYSMSYILSGARYAEQHAR